MCLFLAQSDFNPTQGSVTFLQQSSRECYRQGITNDDRQERTEFFRVSIESDPSIIVIDNPSSALIEISDDDKGLYLYY